MVVERIGIYALSIIGGWLICGAAMGFMRARVGVTRSDKNFGWMTLFLGGTERAIATTLVVYAPSILALFIGGWIALKMAAGWQRRQGDGVEEGNFLALIGNALSFAVAIGCGLWIDDSALAIWKTASS